MFLRTIARPLLASWFIAGGIESVKHPQRRADRSAPVVEPMLRDLGLSVPTTTLVQAHGIATILAASALAVSRTPRTAALALAALATVTVAAGRPFWREVDPELRSQGREAFLKNLSLMGGALLAATAGDDRKRRKGSPKT